MTELEKTKVCPKCGGTMDLRNRKDGSGSFYVCRDKECKTFENVTPYKPTAKKATATTAYAKKVSGKDPNTVAEEFKKTYDEVIALFSSDYPETVADPVALQALVATVFIEKNKRG